MSGNETSKRMLCCRISYSTFGVLLGASVFIVWMVLYSPKEASIHTAAFGGLSGVLAAWNLVTHLMHFQDFWRTWLKGLKYFMAVGVLFMLISTAAFITYIVLAATKKQDLTVTSFYVTSVWCFVTFKWSLLLYLHSKNYRNEFADLTALLEF